MTALYWGGIILVGILGGVSAFRENKASASYTPEQLQAQREWEQDQLDKWAEREEEQLRYDESRARRESQARAESQAALTERKLLNSINETWNI